MRPAHLPVIDIAPLLDDRGDHSAVGRHLDSACRKHGFFYISGHGIPSELIDRLKSLSRTFFALDPAEKLEVEMARAGRAWRGYFPVGGELTSGSPDVKEGLYFGAELDDSHPRVRAGIPLHGPNLFPTRPAGLRAAVLDYMDRMADLGRTIMRGVALGLGLPERHFDPLMADPTMLFRIFHYPPTAPSTADVTWGVGEHTDYGVLTMLHQDETGGLQIRTPEGWIDAPPIAGTFVCNIGDMFDRMTGGLYRSTVHRVWNTSDQGRLSFPFFFDPNWEARIEPIMTGSNEGQEIVERWDGQDLFDFDGTYGEYLLGKVRKVFPDLAGDDKQV